MVDAVIYLVINKEAGLRSIFWTEYQMLDYLNTCYSGTEYFSSLRSSGLISVEELNVSKRTINDITRRIYYRPKGIMEYGVDREIL